jgi:hypothetical protein
MDNPERSYRYLFWRQLIISLTAVGLVYILIFPPIISFAIGEFILPAFDSFIKPDSDIIIAPGRDEFFLSSLSDSYPSVRIDIPFFSVHFWLAMAMIWPTKNRRFSRIIWIYIGLLFLIYPILAISIINGFTWLVPLANVHDKVYKALFMILGILAVREADELLKD